MNKAAFLSIILCFLVIGSCTKEMKTDFPYPDFGYATDHYYLISGEKNQLLRDRNLVSVRFTSPMTNEDIFLFMEKHGLVMVHPVTLEVIKDPVPLTDNNVSLVGQRMSLRVVRKPADHYYTIYGDPNAQSPGNMQFVDYILPVYGAHESKKWTGSTLYVTFNDGLSDGEIAAYADSLASADALVYEKRYKSHRFTLSRQSPLSPLDLSNRYDGLHFIKKTTPGFIVYGVWISH